MAAETFGKYYIRLDIGDNLDVFDIESFIGYRVKLMAGGMLPHLVIEFTAAGALSDDLKKELREETNIKLYEGIDRDTANISDWTVTSPSFKNVGTLTSFRIECLLRTNGYDSQNLTNSITGTSIDVIEHLSMMYLAKTVDALAAPQDSMTWALGLSVPQEAMTRTQVRYWGKDSPNTALAIAVDEVGPVIAKDLRLAIEAGPKYEIHYDSLPTTDLETIEVMADYVVDAHSALQSRVGGANRVTGITTIGDEGSVFADLAFTNDLTSPFAGSRIESTPTYDPSIPGRIDWLGFEDAENVHENWTVARSSNLAQLTRAMDVKITLLAPENLQDVRLLDVVLFKEQTFDRQLLDTFSGLYFITAIERVYDANNRNVSTVLTINKDGA